MSILFVIICSNNNFVCSSSCKKYIILKKLLFDLIKKKSLIYDIDSESFLVVCIFFSFVIVLFKSYNIFAMDKKHLIYFKDISNLFMW